MTDTAVLPGETALAAGSGSGGTGWIDGDDEGSEGWWGWSEEPADEEPPYYRASRLRRAVAVATALAVVAGSMTLVAVVAVGPSGPRYTAGPVHLTSSNARGTETAARFVVTNTSSSPGRATCRLVLGDRSAPVAALTVITPTLRGGGAVTETAVLRHAEPAATRAEARCGTNRA